MGRSTRRSRREERIERNLATRTTFEKKEFFRAIRTGNIGEVRRLIHDFQVDVNIEDEWNNSPLYLACLCGHPDLVEFLLENGADFDPGSIEAQRCFLSSLTENIRQILKKYDNACAVKDTRKHGDMDFTEFLENLYELMPGYDVQLLCKGKMFIAHKCVLASRSAYFNQLLLKASEEPTEDAKLTVSLQEPEFNPIGMRAILQFIYTGYMDFQGADIPLITCIATKLGFEELCREVEKRKNKWRPQKLPGNKITQLQDTEFSVKHKNLTKQLQLDFKKILSTVIPPSIQYIEHEPCSSDTEHKHYPDIGFNVRGYFFTCHKIFFYMRSEYFRILLIENKDNQPPGFGSYLPTVTLDEFEPTDFATIVQFLYSNECEVTESNFLNLLELSNRLAILGLRKYIVQKLKPFINAYNCLEALAISNRLGIKNLVDHVYRFMADNIYQMMPQENFVRFLRVELDPVITGKGQLCEIESVDNIVHYMRKDARAYEDKIEANTKITTFEDFVNSNCNTQIRFLGVDIDVSRYKYGYERSYSRTSHNRKKHKDSSCVIS